MSPRLSQRFLKTLVAVSLVLNVFLIGSIVGGAYRVSGLFAHQRADAEQQRGIRFAAADLSPERQQQLRDALRVTRRESLPLIRQTRDACIDLAHVLAAPTLDRAALDDALTRTRQADMAVRARGKCGRGVRGHAHARRAHETGRRDGALRPTTRSAPEAAAGPAGAVTRGGSCLK